LTERGHPLFAQVARCRRGGVTGKELQADRRLHVGEDGLGTRPQGVQQRRELVRGGDAHVNQVVTGADHGAQRPGLVGAGHRGRQLVVAQPQVLGDHGGVAGVGLRAGQHLPVPPGLDRVRLDRHDRVPGLQQQVDQAAVGPLDRDRHVGGVAEAGQPAGQPGDPVGRMGDRELGGDLARGVHHAHRVDLAAQSIPTNTCAWGSVSGNFSPFIGSDGYPARGTCTGWSLTGALRRFSLLPVPVPGEAGGGGVMMAVFQRPAQAVTPAPAESLPQAP
jgi:hypothetical protein